MFCAHVLLGCLTLAEQDRGRRRQRKRRKRRKQEEEEEEEERGRGRGRRWRRHKKRGRKEEENRSKRWMVEHTQGMHLLLSRWCWQRLAPPALPAACAPFALARADALF